MALFASLHIEISVDIANVSVRVCVCVMTSVWFARVVSFEAKAFFVMCVFAAYEVNNFKNNERRKILFKAASIHSQDQFSKMNSIFIVLYFHLLFENFSH